MTAMGAAPLSHRDRDVRAAVYRLTIETQSVPSAATVAEELGLELKEVRAALIHLGDAHMLAVDAAGEVLMAHPFSASETAFPVDSPRGRYWSNCAWDVFGIATLIETDAVCSTTCADCGEPLEYGVRDGAAIGEGVVHFVVPPSQFWDDIAYT